MQNKILADATNEYIWAIRQLRNMAGLLETRETLTPKQQFDAKTAIERLTKSKDNSEKIILEIIDSVSPEDRHEWALLLAPYIDGGEQNDSNR